MSSRRVFLHVGAPKTGTSFVQDLMFRNREALAQAGVLYPADRFDAHFLAALDLMQLPWGGLEEQAVGAWDRLAAQVRAWEGTVVVSHEILATASPEHIRRARESLAGPDGDAELHVVVSVRDLVRQIPAEWQENVKHRRVLGYRAFLDLIADPTATGAIPAWFWGVQDIPAILDRWAEGLPPDRVHVVTVPAAGAPRDLLWRRFASVFGLDPDAFDLDAVERANPSLGVAEAALVRRLNERVNHGVLPNERYRELVREVLAHRTLSRRVGVRPLRLPDDVRSWATRRCEQWIEELRARAYDVVGDLDDLRPAGDGAAGRAGDPADDPADDPDTPDADEVADAAVDGLVALLRHAATLRDDVDTLHRRLAEVEAERDQAWREAGLVVRAKRSLVRRSDDNPALRLALRAYRSTRGRSG